MRLGAANGRERGDGTAQGEPPNLTPRPINRGSATPRKIHVPDCATKAISTPQIRRATQHAAAIRSGPGALSLAAE